MPDGSLLQFEKIYPSMPRSTRWRRPEEIRANKRYKDVGDFSIAGLAQRLCRISATGRSTSSSTRSPMVRGQETPARHEPGGLLAAVSASAYSLVSLVARLGPLTRPGGSFLSLTYMASERVVPGTGAACPRRRRRSRATRGRWPSSRPQIRAAGKHHLRRALASRAASAIGKIERMVDTTPPTRRSPSPLTAREVGTTPRFSRAPWERDHGDDDLCGQGYHAMGPQWRRGLL